MKYKVTGQSAKIGTDMVLALSKEQVASRQHLLEKVKGGHVARQGLEFKHGEEIGLNVKPDELPRHLADVLACEEWDKAEADRKAREEAARAKAEAVDAAQADVTAKTDAANAARKAADDKPDDAGLNKAAEDAEAALDAANKALDAAIDAAKKG